MKNYSLLFCLLILCFVAFQNPIYAQDRATQVCDHLKITDPQISGRIHQAADEYEAKLVEADGIADETQRGIKKLRANQNYASRVKSVLTPEQKLSFENYNKKEENSFVKRADAPPAKKEVAKTTKKDTKKTTTKKATTKKKTTSKTTKKPTTTKKTSTTKKN
jgi:hypothetical protein